MKRAAPVSTSRRVVYDSVMVVLTGRISTIAFVACALAACGGTEFSAGSDAGSAAQSGDAAPAASCVTPPSATGDEGAFCALETKLFAQCNQCQACRQTDLNNCVALGDALSATFKSALDACSTSISCGDYTTYAGEPCVRTKLANASPTTAQTLAKTKYCTQCATSTADCLDYFKPAASDGGAAGIGYIVLLSSDDIATSIATSCSSSCGPIAYQACAIAQFCTGQAKDACGTGYCGK